MTSGATVISPPGVTVAPVRTSADRREFLSFPRRVRVGDRRWVEPLRFDQARLIRPDHPFYERGAAAHAEFFLARDKTGQAVGRIAAIDNHQHNRHLQEHFPDVPPEGFFGFFDAIDDEAVAAALLDAAAEWLRARGLTRIIGPASPSHNYDYGLLIEGADVTHRFMLAHNPGYYARLLESWGLRKVRDLYAITFDLWNPAVVEKIQSEAERFERIWRERYRDISIRQLDLRRWSSEVRLAVELVNRSLEENWGYSPMSTGELKEMADTLRYVVDPELVLFAEYRGNPVGVSLAVPDLNEVIRQLRFRWSYLELIELFLRAKRHRFDAYRVIALGVARDRAVVGVGPLLFLELFKRFRKRNQHYVDASWILEDNQALLRPMLRFDGALDRTYRMYEREL